MELALGTVQFGLKYGIAGNGAPVPEDEVRSILKAAAERGVRLLDTAPAYGDIEPRLAALCAGLNFKIVSKIPAIPKELASNDAAQWALKSAMESQQRLGPMLQGLMFHNAADLTGKRGEIIWKTLRGWTRNEGLKLGVSCYTPDESAAAHKRFGIEVAQVPGNALDQRLRTLPKDSYEVHLRSAFLQGLLLMPTDMAKRKLPPAAKALDRWQAWCKKTGLDPLQGALSIVKTFKPVSAVVVGVDSLTQFNEIATAWKTVKPIEAADLCEADPAIIDPRQWK